MLSQFRKAGDRFSKNINQMDLFDMPEPTETREDQLLINKIYNPVGEGAYGVVYEDTEPGVLIKEPVVESGFNAFRSLDEELEREANTQAIAAEAGLAPRVIALETTPGKSPQLFMEDIRDKYMKSNEAYTEINTDDENDAFKPYSSVGNKTDVRLQTAQQVGELALRGVALQDRNAGNVFIHKMTGRPKQIDFGIADQVTRGSREQIEALMGATADGFSAAGLNDIGEIFEMTVMRLIKEGDFESAFDVAKQGFSRLQKIKRTSDLQGMG
jgi:hypothetical protein